MEKKNSRFLWLAAVLALVCAGCGTLESMQQKADEQAQHEISVERENVRRLNAELDRQYVELIQHSRAESLNIAREKASERTLEEAIARYRRYIDLGHEIEIKDRERLNTPNRYYEIVTHPWTGEQKTGERANDGWTLVISGDGFLEKNCLYRGVIFNSIAPKGKIARKNMDGKVAYAVVLTPVTKAGNGQVSNVAQENTETDNLGSLLPQGKVPGSYLTPAVGYKRAQPGKPLAGYVVRGAMKVNFENATCMSNALPYSPESFNYVFSSPLVAFKGDIMGVIIPADNYLAYTVVSKAAANEETAAADAFYAISKGTVDDLVAGAQAPSPNGAFIALTANMRFDLRMYKTGGHRAAFTFYGDYLLPPR